MLVEETIDSLSSSKHKRAPTCALRAAPIRTGGGGGSGGSGSSGGGGGHRRALPRIVMCTCRLSANVDDPISLEVMRELAYACPRDVHVPACTCTAPEHALASQAVLRW